MAPDTRLVRTAAAVARPAYRITPSRRAGDAADAGFRVARIDRIGPPLTVARTSAWDEVGTLVHAFLAADTRLCSRSARADVARRLLREAELGGVLEPEALLAMSDRLRATLDARWPAATWAREVPVTALDDTPMGRRRIEGTIDLLGTVPGGLVLVDHKTYPFAGATALVTRATEAIPQVATYARAVSLCGHSVVAACVHFPVAGAWVDLELPLHEPSSCRDDPAQR